jgi:hypothetical protein
VIHFSPKALKMLYRHLPTNNQVFKLQNIPYFSWNVPFTSHLLQNQGFQNVIHFPPKPLKMLYKHLPTHNQVFKLQDWITFETPDFEVI